MQDLTPETAQRLVDEGAILIDIRSQSEFSASHIPGALLLPMDAIDAAAAKALNGRQAIFYCASGVRTANAGAAIDAAGFSNPAKLDGGLDAWRAAGLPVRGTTVAGVGLDIQRQVQITVGTLLLVLTGLAIAVAPGAVYGVGAIGLGLLIAGLTGSCMLARVLMLMPWNRRHAA